MNNNRAFLTGGFVTGVTAVIFYIFGYASARTAFIEAVVLKKTMTDETVPEQLFSWPEK